MDTHYNHYLYFSVNLFKALTCFKPVMWCGSGPRTQMNADLIGSGSTSLQASKIIEHQHLNHLELNIITYMWNAHTKNFSLLSWKAAEKFIFPHSYRFLRTDELQNSFNINKMTGVKENKWFSLIWLQITNLFLTLFI